MRELTLPEIEAVQGGFMGWLLAAIVVARVALALYDALSDKIDATMGN